MRVAALIPIQMFSNVYHNACTRKQKDNTKEKKKANIARTTIGTHIHISFLDDDPSKKDCPLKTELCTLDIFRAHVSGASFSGTLHGRHLPARKRLASEQLAEAKGLGPAMRFAHSAFLPHGGLGGRQGRGGSFNQGLATGHFGLPLSPPPPPEHPRYTIEEKRAGMLLCALVAPHLPWQSSPHASSYGFWAPQDKPWKKKRTRRRKGCI